MAVRAGIIMCWWSDAVSGMSTVAIGGLCLWREHACVRAFVTQRARARQDSALDLLQRQRVDVETADAALPSQFELEQRRGVVAALFQASCPGPAIPVYGDGREALTMEALREQQPTLLRAGAESPRVF